MNNNQELHWNQAVEDSKHAKKEEQQRQILYKQNLANAVKEIKELMALNDFRGHEDVANHALWHGVEVDDLLHALI